MIERSKFVKKKINILRVDKKKKKKLLSEQLGCFDISVRKKEYQEFSLKNSTK